MAKPWRIALCITELRLGGAERCLAELAARLDRSHFEPIVVSLAPPPPEGALSCVPMLTGAGIQPYFLGARRWWDFARVVRHLAELFRRRQVELVQSFLFHANLAARWSVRQSWQPTGPAATAFELPSRKDPAQQSLETQIPRAAPCLRRPVVVSGIRVAERARRWHLWLDRWTQRWVDRYVCVSQSVADFTITEGRIRPEKIVVIPNGIAWENYPAAKPTDLTQLGVRPGRKLIVAIGRLEQQKGFDWLILSAGQWLKPLGDWDLVVVGEGPMRTRLEQEAARQGLADRIHFPGLRLDVAEILAASSLLVLPSRWEGMPNVLLEAMASRLPVVATRVEGVAELLGPGFQEQTIPCGDPAALAERAARILGDPALANRLAQENQRRVREHFGIDRMVQAYQDLWRQLLERRESFNPPGPGAFR